MSFFIVLFNENLHLSLAVFLGEKWLNIYNRTMENSVLTASEKLNILGGYFTDVAKLIKSGYSKQRGTGKLICILGQR